MNLPTSYLRFLRRDRQTWWGWPLFQVLKALSSLYLLGWWVRRSWSGLFPAKRLLCPVLSVGNLTVGGTGKTPLVIHLAKHFIAQGKRVAVLSRGYGRRDEGSLVWVSDGKALLATPEEGGDEPVLIAKSVPKAAVISCSDRVRAGREAVERFQPDLILLDDGFQRRRSLHRDLDILVLDATDPFSTGHVLPAGLLREPLGVLKEAGVLVLNKWDLAADPKGLKALLKALFPKTPFVTGRYRTEGIRNIRTGKKVPLPSLRRMSIGAFCGLAGPTSFLKGLAGLGIRPERSLLFPDHFAYTERDLRDILEAARAQGLKALVTTAKDEVKLPRIPSVSIPILTLDIRWEPTEGKDRLESALRKVFARGS